MIDSGLMLSMVFALMTTFMVPVVVLMWLLVKKKAKSVLFLFLIGAMSFFAGYILLVVPFDFFIFSKETFTEFADKYNFISSLIIAVDFGLAVIISMVAFMYILKPGGITFNRTVAYAMGFMGIYNMYSFGIKYISKFTMLESIQNDTLAEKYPNASPESLAQMKEEITGASSFLYIAEAVRHVAFLTIGAGIALAIVYGIIQKKIVPEVLKMLGYMIGCYYVYEVSSHYIHPAVAIPVMVVATIPAVLIIKKFAKNPKEVMIKPEAMQML